MTVVPATDVTGVLEAVPAGLVPWCPGMVQESLVTCRSAPFFPGKDA